MTDRIAAVQLVVRDYDEAIAFYRDMLDFEIVEDIVQPAQSKRWVTMRPAGGGAVIVLGKPSKPEQAAFIGNQTGGRVAFFLATDDFETRHAVLAARGVRFVREPKVEAYGVVAVFADLYGNLWDLVQFVPGHPLA